MLQPCEWFTEILQGEISDISGINPYNFTIIYNDKSQRYEVLQFLEDEKRTTCIHEFDKFDWSVTKMIRKNIYENIKSWENLNEYVYQQRNRRDNQEYQREHSMDDFAHDFAHDMWHASGKRVW
jgi:hypothetical protein